MRAGRNLRGYDRATKIADAWTGDAGADVPRSFEDQPTVAILLREVAACAGRFEEPLIEGIVRFGRARDDLTVGAAAEQLDAGVERSAGR
jgi:hypothetical protein